MRKTLSSVIAALAAIGFAGGAMAADISVTVDYSDLDPKTAEGAAELEARIDAAVRTVCRRATPLSVRAFQTYLECKQATKEAAMDQVPAEELSLANPYEGLELASIF